MSNTNAHKPGYKHTPLGWIPEEWSYMRLDKIANVVRGSSPRPAGDTRYFGGDYIPWLTVASLTTISDAQVEVVRTDGYLTEQGSLQSRILDKGTLILSNSGATLGVAKILGIKCCANDGIAAFINLDERQAYKMYMLYYLNSLTRYFRDVIAPGNGQPNLNTELIGTTFIPLPNFVEQHKIATILSTWDEAIQKTQQLIEQLKQRNKGLMQQLLAGKKRLKGFTGKWRKRPANELFKSLSKKNNGNEPLLSVTQDRGVIPRDMLEARVTMPDGSTEGYKLVETGDFIISLRSFQGGLEYSEYRGIVSPAYTVLKPVVPINDSFYKYYYKSYDFIGHLAVAVIGIRDGKQISFEDFSALTLPYPSLEEQEAIAAVLSQAYNELNLQEQQLATLQEQKKGLMQKLLSGEVRVIH